MKKELIVHKDPKSPISEIFRTLRTNIQFMDSRKSSTTILITSTFAGEGKSWVSSNLATTFAQTGKKVLIIDADMRKGRQYSIFGIAPRPGLSNYLSGVSEIEDGKEVSEYVTDYIQMTEIQNLYVMVAGNIPPNPSELLISPQMIDMLEQVKQIFDVVIIDGTPSQLVTDSIILSRMVDSTIIVTASEETKKEDLKRVINNIKNVGGKISGVVLNKIAVSSKKYEQSYYYSVNTNDRTTSKRKENVYTRMDLEGVKKNSKYLTNQKESSKKETVKQKYGEKEKKQTGNMETYIENAPEISLEKTNDILKQINDYLDKEKNNLK